MIGIAAVFGAVSIFAADFWLKSDASAQVETRTVEMGPYARLLIYSDGVFEIERPGGVMWQHPEFIEFVAGLLPADQPLIPPILTKACELRGQELFADDFSVVEARL